MVEIYIAPEVAEVRALHPYLVDPGFRDSPMRAQISRQAQTVHAAHQSGDSRVRMHLLSWWPGARGTTLDRVMAGPFTSDDALLTLSREYGFDDWATVDALGSEAPDPEFEAALDALLKGDTGHLGDLLSRHPSLAAARSRYGHRSTLLHYLGANGVESHRQCTPLNAPTLAALLISRGADPRAEAMMYGGGQTPLALASTSAHPHSAGVSAALNSALTP